MMNAATLHLPAPAAETAPFPHRQITGILDDTDASATLAWLSEHARWQLRVEDFYEQHEFSLLVQRPPDQLQDLISPATITNLSRWLGGTFTVPGTLELVDISAHRLTSGQTIRIHNDFIEGAETHRLLIQLNAGWTVEQGGLLMLFAEDRPETLAKALLPVHGDGFAFEISPRSHHAVSTVHTGERFTLVYTFRVLPEAEAPWQTASAGT